MATLNIKNLPDALYKKLQARAKRERRSRTWAAGGSVSILRSLSTSWRKMRGSCRQSNRYSGRQTRVGENW